MAIGKNFLFVDFQITIFVKILVSIKLLMTYRFSV